MKLKLYIAIFCLGALQCFGQTFERKIIIENNTFYYVTVDDNYQLATLYTGDPTKPLKEGKAYAVPAGRGISAETNPLAWDVKDGQMYAVNFLDHSLNDRNESIKKFALADLNVWSASTSIEDLIMESVDRNMLVLNEPYIFIKERSKFLNHFYFDAITVGNDYWMVITNNDELTIWKYADNSWKHSVVIPYPTTGAFSLMAFKNKLRMVTNDGAVYSLDLKTMKALQIAATNQLKLSELTIVENRDTKTVYALKNGLINFDKTIKEMVQNGGFELINE